MEKNNSIREENVSTVMTDTPDKTVAETPVKTHSRRRLPAPDGKPFRTTNPDLKRRWKI